MYDVVIVGAGPGGSAAAAWLAKAGVKVALLERHTFPRDKVCGDGLTPQALWWIDALECLDQVLEQTSCAIDKCDLFINKRKIVTSSFPLDSAYPPFLSLLDRSKLDTILAYYARRCGASLHENRSVKNIELDKDGITATALDSKGQTHTYRGKIAIGADGAGSMVSRLLGNTPSKGVKALSMRAHFDDVRIEGAQVKLFFEEPFFPGYGWLFVDDRGHANIGVGCISDPPYCHPIDLRSVFDSFIKNDLGTWLKNARQTTPLRGGWACFSQPRTLSGERLLIIGDAANMADPLNGGGIHKAIESASIACTTVYQALTQGSFNADSMYTYDRRWNSLIGPDRRSADLLLSFAKYAPMRTLYLAALERIGSIIAGDQRFGEFATGIFTGTTPQREILSIEKLFSVIPHDPRKFLGTGLQFRSVIADASSLLLGSIHSGREAMQSPHLFASWCTEIAGRLILAGTEAIEQTSLQYHPLSSNTIITNSGGSYGS